ncbi:hypothetical protein K6119_02610 [Paracrocinitomix mangrovi]|uniref:hypothetical protein n=1 Tax=Paracrocinitomix mangrovi TaxID=2862509 RepID=UPI001C8EBA30|nr:hypothetical protein [Paracrocinitomix mangrovi]UKN02411.1 hypothetical protein K6119_02610 [Paracrocinitomix mangrovi]
MRLIQLFLILIAAASCSGEKEYVNNIDNAVSEIVFVGSDLSVRNLDSKKIALEYQKANNSIYRLDYELVARGKFIFIKQTNYSKDELKQSNNVTEKYFGYQAGMSVYKLDEDTLSNDLKKLLNQYCYLYDYTGKEKKILMKEIVMISDMAESQPYYAIPLNKYDGIEYYSFASVNQIPKSSFYNSVANYDNIERHKVIDHFLKGPEYKLFKKEYLNKEVDYYQTTANVCSNGSKDSIYVVQCAIIGDCEFIDEIVRCVYVKKGRSFELIGVSNMNQYLMSMVDLNNDGVLEMLTGEFAATTFLELQDKHYESKRTLQWSIEECPC